MTDVVLELVDVCTELALASGPVLAVDHVSFAVHEGETVGVVGESGCGKSITALSVMQLVPSPPGKIVAGEIRWRGRNLLALRDSQMNDIRGREIAMVFQEPMTSLNPVFRVGTQIAEAIRVHQKVSRAGARVQAIDLLRQVGIAAPESRVDAYPHEMSGGMRQRVMMAMALSCNPSLLIADEPTTALDVTVQAQILALLRAQQKTRGLAVMLITHDLGVVAETCDRVVVMYAGHVVEDSPVDALFKTPVHPYTVGLLKSLPKEDEAERARLPAIEGTVPSLSERPSGCRFRTRCDRATEICAQVDPPLEEKRPGQKAACHHPA